MNKFNTFISKTAVAMGIGAALVAGSVVYAAANIPVACSTPGDCTELDATFLELTTQTVARFLDADASHSVGLQAPATVPADVVFTLPAEDGQVGQTLRTDGSGNLSFDQVSKRVGEMIFATTDASKTAANGYLAVSPGTVTGGATDYPVWAAMYPEFVSGSDIVFPANVNGIFLRNLGGNAGTEGVFQNDATAPNSLSTASGGAHTHGVDEPPAASDADGGSSDSHVALGDNDAGRTHPEITTQSAGAHGHTINGDTETRPFNYAYQLYTIVDTY